MAQGVLPFKYEQEKKTVGMTALAGLGVYLDMAHRMGLSESIERHVHVRTSGQGWTDSQIVTALIFLNLAGGDCVEDIQVLEADEGFCEVLKQAELYGISRRQRRQILRRWRKQHRRSVASSSSIFRYLAAFHDSGQEQLRHRGKAFIPQANEHLKGLCRVNTDLAACAQRQVPQRIATLDMDATLIETNKREALYCYKGYKSYQPLNTWWAEMELVLHTEFRDGNVPAGYEQLRVLKQALACVPSGVEKVRLRSDTAGYQHELLSYCEAARHERFGRIEFAISCDVTQEFKKAVAELDESAWQAVYKEVDGKRCETRSEWAEVCFVPSAIGHSKKGPVYRYLARREVFAEQPVLPGIAEQPQLPFQTIDLQGKRYKLFGLVTNMDWEGGQLINWQYERCGKSEAAHAAMKHDLAGGKLPSGDFGENAAWWWIMVLAHNINGLVKRHALGGAWSSKRMKAIRFGLINLPGRVIKHARNLIIRVAHGHPSYGLLLEARKMISLMVPVPSG